MERQKIARTIVDGFARVYLDEPIECGDYRIFPKDGHMVRIQTPWEAPWKGIVFVVRENDEIEFREDGKLVRITARSLPKNFSLVPDHEQIRYTTVTLSQ